MLSWQPVQPPSGPFHAVLLDVDGTLIDTAELIADSLAHACEQHLGRTHPRSEYYALIGKPARVQMEILGGAALAAEMEETAIEFYERYPDREQPFPGVLDALARLCEVGLRIALVTSKTRRELNPTLERIPLHRYAGTMVTADLTTRPKPFPDPVYLALQTLEVGADRAIFAGDSPYDLQAGRAAGVRTAAALWGPHPRAALAAEKPDYLLENIGSLVRVCGAAPGR
jgi:pyrophosphatase PpaX